MTQLKEIIIITHFDSNQDGCFENNVRVPCPDPIEEFKIKQFAVDLQKITHLKTRLASADEVTFQDNVFYVIFTYSLYYFMQKLEGLTAAARLNLTKRMFLFTGTGKRPGSFENNLFAGSLHLSYYQLCSKYTQVMPFTERSNNFFFLGLAEAMESLKKRYKIQDIKTSSIDNNYATWKFQEDIILEIGLYLQNYVEAFGKIQSLDHWSKSFKTNH